MQGTPRFCFFTILRRNYETTAQHDHSTSLAAKELSNE